MGFLYLLFLNNVVILINLLLKINNSSLSIEDYHYSYMFRHFIPNIYLYLAILIALLGVLDNVLVLYGAGHLTDM